jgi:hypothetical protein
VRSSTQGAGQRGFWREIKTQFDHLKVAGATCVVGGDFAGGFWREIKTQFDHLKVAGATCVVGGDFAGSRLLLRRLEMKGQGANLGGTKHLESWQFSAFGNFEVEIVEIRLVWCKKWVFLGHW